MPRAGCTTRATGSSTRTCLPTCTQVTPCRASTRLPSSLTRPLKPYLGPSRSAFLPAAVCLPFAPALCLSLLALCTRPVSLSACPLHLPCVSLCFCHYLSPNGVCFAINFCDSPVKWSPYTVMIDVWLHASMSQLGLQASLQAVRDQNFVAVALKLALRLAFQNPLASWSISNGSSNYNVVLCTALAATTVSSLSSMCSVCTVQTANPPVHIHLGCPEPAAVAGCHVQRAQPLGQRHFSLSLLDCFESLVTWCMIICASIDTHFVL